MTDEHDLITSPLACDFTSEGKTVQICIYRLPDTGWNLEVIDEFSNSTIWDEEFETDQAALDVFMQEFERDGIEAFILSREHSAVFDD